MSSHYQPPSGHFDAVIELVREERRRQDEMFGWHNGYGESYMPADNANSAAMMRKLAVLTEEVGEVARELCDGGEFTANLRDELVQVAALAVVWLESIERDITKMNEGVDEDCP